MGICLSCLRPNYDDNDLNNDYSENTPLLNDEDNAVNSHFYEARNNELEDIVNNTNENLIDVTNFHLDTNQEVQPSEKGANSLNSTLHSEKDLSELEAKVREDFAIDESLKSLPLVLNLE
ncbi:hypothetical protein LJB42_004742 [Komagataella kurtzmanii]|nr:hypothetical protein LJB42_004742 [Komagataella kurtzmanii]